MNRKFAVVTTFNDKGLQTYAQRMIDGFCQNWPKEITLHLYPENTNPRVPDHSQIELIDMATGVPDLMAFKSKWKDVPMANGDISGVPRLASRKDSHKPFKWDAVRFSHKVYSIFHCAKNCNADVLIWMDADMVCHSPVTMEKINEMIPEGIDLCYLGRKGKFSECGLYSMNLRSPMIKTFLQEFQHMYDNAERGIFYLDEWHDSFVFDAVRQKMPFLQQLDWSNGVITGEGHPLINTQWGAYLDHLKGDRKTQGRSSLKDLKVKRSESYWR